MRRYSIVSPMFWIGSTGKKIKGNKAAQILAMYLITNPHANMIGLYYLPMPLILHETGLSTKDVNSAFSVLSDSSNGFAYYDTENDFVWVPNMARWQIGKTLSKKDGRHKSVAKEVKKTKRSIFYIELVKKYNKSFNLGLDNEINDIKGPLEGGVGGTPKAPLRVPPEAPYIQEQEQEQDQEQNKEKRNIKEKRKTPAPILGIQFKPPGMDVEDWKDLIEHRKKRKATNTDRALKALSRQLMLAHKNNWDYRDLVDTITNRNWTGFSATWLREDDRPPRSKVRGLVL